LQPRRAWYLDGRPGGLPPLVKLAAVVHAVLLDEGAAKRPDRGKGKVRLEQGLGVEWARRSVVVRAVWEREHRSIGVEGRRWVGFKGPTCGLRAWSALLLRFSGLSRPSSVLTSVVTRFMVPE
jgi:hypothetical protein